MRTLTILILILSGTLARGEASIGMGDEDVFKTLGRQAAQILTSNPSAFALSLTDVTVFGQLVDKWKVEFKAHVYASLVPNQVCDSVSSSCWEVDGLAARKERKISVNTNLWEKMNELQHLQLSALLYAQASALYESTPASLASQRRTLLSRILAEAVEKGKIPYDETARLKNDGALRIAVLQDRRTYAISPDGPFINQCLEGLNQQAPHEAVLPIYSSSVSTSPNAKSDTEKAVDELAQRGIRLFHSSGDSRASQYAIAHLSWAIDQLNTLFGDDRSSIVPLSFEAVVPPSARQMGGAGFEFQGYAGLKIRYVVMSKSCSTAIAQVREALAALRAQEVLHRNVEAVVVEQAGVDAGIAGFCKSLLHTPEISIKRITETVKLGRATLEEAKKVFLDKALASVGVGGYVPIAIGAVDAQPLLGDGFAFTARYSVYPEACLQVLPDFQARFKEAVGGMERRFQR